MELKRRMGTISILNKKQKDREERKKKGLCVRCGKKAEEDKNYCRECLDKRAKEGRIYHKGKKDYWKEQ